MPTKRITKENHAEIALKSAVRLHDYIRTNAGETADWPLQIFSTEKEAVEKLEELMVDFKKNYMKYSSKKK